MPVNSIDQKFRELISTQIAYVTLCTFIFNYLIIFVFEGKIKHREILWCSVNSIAHAIEYLYLIERNEKYMISINKITIWIYYVSSDALLKKTNLSSSIHNTIYLYVGPWTKSQLYMPVNWVIHVPELSRMNYVFISHTWFSTGEGPWTEPYMV